MINAVRRLRKELGVTQCQLAESSGISQSTISRLERGSVRDVKYGDIQGIAKALGATVAIVLGEAYTVAQPPTVLPAGSVSIPSVLRGGVTMYAERHGISLDEAVERLLLAGLVEGTRPKGKFR